MKKTNTYMMNMWMCMYENMFLNTDYKLPIFNNQ